MSSLPFSSYISHGNARLISTPWPQGKSTKKSQGAGIDAIDHLDRYAAGSVTLPADSGVYADQLVNSALRL